DVGRSQEIGTIGRAAGRSPPGPRSRGRLIERTQHHTHRIARPARRAFAFQETNMPVFTIETTYRIPVYRQRRYEASTLADACRLAIEDANWEGSKQDYECAGETHVT